MARQQNNSTSGIGGNKYLFLGVTVAVALAYFGLVQPAGRQVALLQQQCDALNAVVARLDSRADAAGRGMHLVDMLDKQGSQIASAETALRELVDLRRRLSDETRQIVSAVGALDQLETVRTQVAEHGRRLAKTSNALRQMEQVAASSAEALQQIDQVATSIHASCDSAQEAQGSLHELDQRQTELAAGLTRVAGTFPALEPVVEDVQELCDQLADSDDQVSRAMEVNQRFGALQGQLAHAADTLPQAEQACQQMGSLCEKLGDQSDSVVSAQRQLAGLCRLKADLLSQNQDLPDAAAMLTQLGELRDGLLHSSGTLGEIQHLVVDMVLLEPAVKRAMLSLKPVVEMTRLSRQVESPQVKTAATDEGGKKNTANAEAGADGAQAGNAQVSPNPSWSELVEVAVAWCQRTLK